MSASQPHLTPDPQAPPFPPPKRRKYRRVMALTTLVIVLIAAAGIALWSWLALTYVYSSGQHTGYVRKLSHTGWLCKTWEGQLVTTPTPAVPSQLFTFTIRNDSLATLLQSAQDKQVTLSYSQHLSGPSTCFGETQYFIDGVTIRP